MLVGVRDLFPTRLAARWWPGLPSGGSYPYLLPHMPSSTSLAATGCTSRDLARQQRRQEGNAPHPCRWSSCGGWSVLSPMKGKTENNPA